MPKIFTKRAVSKGVAILLCLWLMTFLLTGCGSQATSNTPANSASAGNSSQETTRVITDMAGRQVNIPKKINTVYCAVPTAEAMLYSLAPEKLVAWVNAPSTDLKKYLSDRAKNLPILGGWMGEKSTANLEEIAKLAPELIVFMTDLDENNKVSAVQTANSITDQTKRPVIVLDSIITSTPKVYRIMGDILGVQDRAEKLAAYTEQKMAAVSDMVAKIPKDKLVSVYYAEGNTGLATDPEASHHAEVLKFAGGKNVANVQAKSGQGMSPVSMEQVLAWNPDLILVSSSTGGDKNYQTILNDPAWSKIKAVKDKKVYITPLLPFGWFDRPPNIMRALGTEWLSNLLYPEYVKIDLNKETKDFFKLFFNMDLSDQQVNELLINAVAK
ncbi:ABC transporter substrate-binding protein [Desulfosporosinus fructosivorans]|uniref:ABC transporter substrate-binding protein n=1 Tax=Desulfosporosinus fructosivorans TaxID=2018669 RepID=A0A4Z0R769_9FIRM|nr:ABC transporter substrate-binding protein [Desulfosporosinus fructosivorans]TGE37963.1 ABC transporter substrate-binding protein [Desulfosporosinus fructosivorans]